MGHVVHSQNNLNQLIIAISYFGIAPKGPLPLKQLV